jgi:hypothetical protein
MARRLTASLVALPMAVLLATSCLTEPDPRIEWTRYLFTHRGEHLVLDVAAVLLPDGMPANITCSGAVAASGVGTVQDSVPVVHHESAQVFHVMCAAESGGASAVQTGQYTLFGPSLLGTWVGRGTIGGQRISFELRDVAVPCGNSWTMEDTDYGTRVSGTCLEVGAGTPDSFHLRGYAPDPGEDRWRLEASRSEFSNGEFRVLRGRVWSYRITDPTYWGPYVVERN